ncbi:MAG: helix-turn-helix transcriptional regulator [Gammaproteobacteria bacterium]|nr:helix-turn-helix transcriptional regulator [Gammaproteobacteria bacterium]
MESSSATRMFEALSSPVRLTVFRRLVREGPEGMVASAIAEALDLPPTNLSFHLKNLSQAGLVSATQEGRFQRYRAHVEVMVELISYLAEDCCAGAFEQCIELPLPTAPGRRRSTTRPARPVTRPTR